MLELLRTGLDLVVGLASSVWGVVSSVAGFSWDLLQWLHLESPRLEGLLVGVLLAWLMIRRDKHPLLRVLSAPLKLVVDILDLAWDQCVEVVRDLWGTATGWVKGSLGWAKDRVVGSYNWVMGSLSSVKNALSRKKD